MYGRHDSYTWGLRIYRTSYSEPNADAEFNRAVDVLHSYMREEIFYDFENHGEPWVKKDPNVNDGLDDAPQEQLWERLQNDIVQDREVLEGASPARLSELHHEWLESRGGKTMNNCRNRYSLILDEEVIDNLLFLPVPDVQISPTICLKVLDRKSVV